jgi:hypothetical protein
LTATALTLNLTTIFAIPAPSCLQQWQSTAIASPLVLAPKTVPGLPALTVGMGWFVTISGSPESLAASDSGGVSGCRDAGVLKSLPSAPLISVPPLIVQTAPESPAFSP